MRLPRGAVLSTSTVPRLAVATPEQIARVFAESHSLWGAGLTLDDYRGMWEDLQDTPWGRRWFTYHVLVGEGGAVLSSLKLYRPAVSLAGDVRRATAIGAVFTPRRARREGHARALMEAVLAAARGRGDGIALLFSDIGLEYYEALGFRALPSEEASGVLARSLPQAPAGWTLRPMLPEDLDRVREVHDAWCAKRPFALLRDLDHWGFIYERARTFFDRLDGSDLSSRYRIALRDGRFAGYVIGVAGEGEWNLREAAVADGSDESLAALLRVAAAAARAEGNRRVYGWIPRELAPLVPEWRLRYQPRSRAVAMALPLASDVPPLPFESAPDAFIPYLDQF